MEEESGLPLLRGISRLPALHRVAFGVLPPLRLLPQWGISQLARCTSLIYCCGLQPTKVDGTKAQFGFHGAAGCFRKGRPHVHYPKWVLAHAANFYPAPNQAIVL